MRKWTVRTRGRITTSSSKRRRSKTGMMTSMLNNRRARTRFFSRRSRIRTGNNIRRYKSRIKIEAADRNSAFGRCRTRTRNNGKLNNSKMDRIRAGSNSEIGNGSMGTGSSTMPGGARNLIVIRTSSAFGRAPGKTIAPETGGQITAIGSSAADTVVTGFPRTVIAATSARSIGSGSPACLSLFMADTRASSTRATG